MSLLSRGIYPKCPFCCPLVCLPSLKAFSFKHVIISRISRVKWDLSIFMGCQGTSEKSYFEGVHLMLLSSNVPLFKKNFNFAFGLSSSL